VTRNDDDDDDTNNNSSSRYRCPRGLRRSYWPLGCWDRRFESRSGYGCLSICLYVVLYCVGRSLCDELITRPKESYYVSSTTTETLKRIPWPDLGWSAIGMN
jgi:hypothetical protein